MCKNAPNCGCCHDSNGMTLADYEAQAKSEREAGCCMYPDRDMLMAEARGDKEFGVDN